MLIFQMAVKHSIIVSMWREWQEKQKGKEGAKKGHSAGEEKYRTVQNIVDKIPVQRATSRRTKRPMSS
jgi:hypothetical protein